MIDGFIAELDMFLLNNEKCAQEEREQIIKFVIKEMERDD